MRILLSPVAQKDLAGLDKQIAKRVVDKLGEYEKRPDPMEFAKRLHEDPEGTYRFRIGEWRAKCIVEKDIIVTRIRHRSEAYR